MNPNDQRAEGIFATAMDLTDPPARQAYLNHTCMSSPALRAGVEPPLRAHGQAGDPLCPTIQYGLREGLAGFGCFEKCDEERPCRPS